MSSAIMPRCLALLLAFTGLAGADEIRVYRLQLKGPAPGLPELQARLDPGRAFAGTIDADGNFDIDKTDPSVASPDPTAKEPRRLGIRITGRLASVENDPTQTRVRLRFRECRVVPSKGSKVDKLLYPDSKSWTESLQELLGRLDEKGWALLDPQGDDGKVRAAFVVEVLR